MLLGGAITDGGAYVSWLRALLGLEDDVAFNEVLADAATAEVKRQMDRESETNEMNKIIQCFLSLVRFSIVYKGACVYYHPLIYSELSPSH